MTTAVFFALDGTVLEFARPYRELLEATFAATVEATGADLVDAYTEAFTEHFGAFEPDPHLEGMRAVCETADVDADPAALVEGLRERELKATAVSDAARSSFEKLAAEHHLGIITNGVRDWQTAKLDHHDLGMFDTVVASYEAGAHKPDAAPFDLARERADADEYVMVGDDYEADVVGARNAGFTPVHYEPDDGLDFWAILDALV